MKEISRGLTRIVYSCGDNVIKIPNISVDSFAKKKKEFENRRGKEEKYQSRLKYIKNALFDIIDWRLGSGMQANSLENLNYKKFKHHPLLAPTKLSLCGLLNIQEKVVPLNHPDNKFLMAAILRPLYTKMIKNGEGKLGAWLDHTLNNESNFGINKDGKVILLDYALDHKQFSIFMKKYGDMIYTYLNDVFDSKRINEIIDITNSTKDIDFIKEVQENMPSIAKLFARQIKKIGR